MRGYTADPRKRKEDGAAMTDAGAGSSDPPDGQPVTKRAAYTSLGALCVGLFLTMMDPALVAVAMPQIQAEFGASYNEIFWVSAVYLLAFAGPLLVTGRLGDRYGQRQIYLIGMVLFAAGAFAAALAPSISGLIAARAVQGLGASLLNPQPLSMINRIFPRTSRGTALGIWSAVASSASLFGPVVGGLFVGFASWRWMFALYLPAGLISLVLVARYVPRLPRSAPAIHVPSAVISLIAIVGIVFAVQQGPEWGWSAPIWLCLAVGVIALLGFILLQRALGTRALMPLKLFRTKNFSLAVVAVFALGMVNYSFQLPLMLYLQTGLGMPAERAAILLIPMGLMSVLVAPIAGRLTDRLKPGILSPIGFLLVIAAMVGFVLLVLRESGPGWFLLPIVLLGLGIGLAWTPNSVIAMRTLPVDVVGAGSGVYTTSRQVAAVLGVAAMGATMQSVSASVTVAAAAALAVPIVFLVIGLVAVTRFDDDR